MRIVSKESVQDVNEHETLEICVGAKVMLLKNLDTTMGLVNGSQGYVKDIIYEENEPSVIMVAFDSYTGDMLGSNAIPILPQKYKVTKTSSGGSTSSWYRTHFPLRLSWGITVHKSQALTLRKVVIDLRGFPRPLCYKLYVLFFVSLSRVCNFEDILLMHDAEKYMVSSTHDEGIKQRLADESRLELLCRETLTRYGFA